MESQAQKIANKKYRKENVSQINLRFYPSEEAILNHARKLKPSGIKQIIKKDMETRNGN